LEDWASNSIREKFVRNYAAAGGKALNGNSVQVESRAALLNIDSAAIISVVTRIWVLDAGNRSQRGMFVKVVRLRDDVLHQVTCISDGAEDFNIWSGACGSKIQDSLQVKLDAVQ
jgi:hypothetical protein